MFDVVALTGSQGGFAAARDLLGALPEMFGAAVVLSLHRAAHTPDVLVPLLQRTTALPVRLVEGDGPLTPGTVHVASSTADVTVAAPGRVATEPVERGPRRISGDLLLRSAAAAYGPRTIGVVLSGRMSDGADGALAVRRAGGRVLVQSPASAACGAMPAAALATGCVDFAFAPRVLGAALTSLVMAPGASDLFRVRAHPGLAFVA